MPGLWRRLKAVVVVAPIRFLVMAQSHCSVQFGGLCRSQWALQFVGLPPPGHDDAAKVGGVSASDTHPVTIAANSESLMLASLVERLLPADGIGDSDAHASYLARAAPGWGRPRPGCARCVAGSALNVNAAAGVPRPAGLRCAAHYRRTGAIALRPDDGAWRQGFATALIFQEKGQAQGPPYKSTLPRMGTP